MGFLDLDFDNAVEPCTVAPDMEYELRIVEVKEGLDKNGNAYIMPRFEVTNEVGAKDFTKFFGLPNDSDSPKRKNSKLWALKLFCESFKIDPKTAVESWVGQTGWALLGVEENEQYGPQNYVKRFV